MASIHLSTDEFVIMDCVARSSYPISTRYLFVEVMDKFPTERNNAWKRDDILQTIDALINAELLLFNADDRLVLSEDAWGSLTMN